MPPSYRAPWPANPRGSAAPGHNRHLKGGAGRPAGGFLVARSDILGAAKETGRLMNHTDGKQTYILPRGIAACEIAGFRKQGDACVYNRRLCRAWAYGYSSMASDVLRAQPKSSSHCAASLKANHKGNPQIQFCNMAKFLN